MPPLGKIEEFDPKTQNFESYLERFENFPTTDEIAEVKHLPVFLTVIGPEAYEELISLVVPEVPGQNAYEDVKRLLKEHCSTRSFVIAGTVRVQPARTTGKEKFRRVHRET